MPELWIASNNAKKKGELSRLLAPLGYSVRTQSEAPRPVPPVEEDRPDFAGNAEKKAATLARAVGAHAIGDDSGLCVDALDGAPGVHSARYAGRDASDADRTAKLLAALREAAPADRTARFVCHLCLCGPDGGVVTRFEAACEGTIAESPRGEQGFGYDPVFLAADGPPGRTFAELTPEEKDSISHRGIALRRLVAYLQDRPLAD